MSGDDLFTVLGFSWDRTLAQLPVSTQSVQTVVGDFDARLAGHVWSAAVLEGNPFTYPEVQTLLDGITVGGHRVSDANQVLALRDSYVRLREMVLDGSFALTKPVSDELHSIVARHESIESGHFRGEGAATGGGWVMRGERGYHQAPDSGPGLAYLYQQGVDALGAVDAPFERACAYFLFAARHQFYFDGNKRTARALMNGELMRHGIPAVLIPGAARLEFNTKMVNFYADGAATEMFEFLASCGPREDVTHKRLIAISRGGRSSGRSTDAGLTS